MLPSDDMQSLLDCATSKLMLSLYLICDGQRWLHIHHDLFCYVSSLEHLRTLIS